MQVYKACTPVYKKQRKLSEPKMCRGTRVLISKDKRPPIRQNRNVFTTCTMTFSILKWERRGCHHRSLFWVHSPMTGEMLSLWKRMSTRTLNELFLFNILLNFLKIHLKEISSSCDWHLLTCEACRRWEKSQKPPSAVWSQSFRYLCAW